MPNFPLGLSALISLSKSTLSNAHFLSHALLATYWDILGHTGCVFLPFLPVAELAAARNSGPPCLPFQVRTARCEHRAQRHASIATQRRCSARAGHDVLLGLLWAATRVIFAKSCPLAVPEVCPRGVKAIDSCARDARRCRRHVGEPRRMPVVTERRTTRTTALLESAFLGSCCQKQRRRTAFAARSVFISHRPSSLYWGR